MKAVKASAIPPESEAHFQAFVVALAKRLGWMVYHTYDSRRSQGGFPDLVLVRGARAIFAELKSAKGKVSPAQATWLRALESTAAEVYLWSPSAKQDIVDVLR